MKNLAFLSIALLFLGAFAYAGTDPCQGGVGSVGTFNMPCFFYGGDLDLNDPNQNGLANENDAIVGGNPYGAATYQSFTIATGGLQGLFTNNLMSYTPTSAYWEVRGGVSEGNGGTLIASGTASDSSHLRVTPTGRSDFGYTEYTVAELSSVALSSGTYWESVVPICTTCNGRSFNSNANTHLNSVGTQEDGDQFFNSPFFGANFTNANSQGVFNNFSSGVISNQVPEPSSMIMLGTGLVAVAGVVRRRLSR